jgi:hypothetical protein
MESSFIKHREIALFDALHKNGCELLTTGKFV